MENSPTKIFSFQNEDAIEQISESDACFLQRALLSQYQGLMSQLDAGCIDMHGMNQEVLTCWRKSAFTFLEDYHQSMEDASADVQGRGNPSLDFFTAVAKRQEAEDYVFSSEESNLQLRCYAMTDECGQDVLAFLRKQCPPDRIHLHSPAGQRMWQYCVGGTSRHIPTDLLVSGQIVYPDLELNLEDSAACRAQLRIALYPDYAQRIAEAQAWADAAKETDGSFYEDQHGVAEVGYLDFMMPLFQSGLVVPLGVMAGLPYLLLDAYPMKYGSRSAYMLKQPVGREKGYLWSMTEMLHYWYAVQSLAFREETSGLFADGRKVKYRRKYICGERISEETRFCIDHRITDAALDQWIGKEEKDVLCKTTGGSSADVSGTRESHTADDIGTAD